MHWTMWTQVNGRGEGRGITFNLGRLEWFVMPKVLYCIVPKGI